MMIRSRGGKFFGQESTAHRRRGSVGACDAVSAGDTCRPRGVARKRSVAEARHGVDPEFPPFTAFRVRLPWASSSSRQGEKTRVPGFVFCAGTAASPTSTRGYRRRIVWESSEPLKMVCCFFCRQDTVREELPREPPDDLLDPSFSVLSYDGGKASRCPPCKSEPLPLYRVALELGDLQLRLRPLSFFSSLSAFCRQARKRSVAQQCQCSQSSSSRLASAAFTSCCLSSFAPPRTLRTLPAEPVTRQGPGSCCDCYPDEKTASVAEVDQRGHRTSVSLSGLRPCECNSARDAEKKDSFSASGVPEAGSGLPDGMPASLLEDERSASGVFARDGGGQGRLPEAGRFSDTPQAQQASKHAFRMEETSRGVSTGSGLPSLAEERRIFPSRKVRKEGPFFSFLSRNLPRCQSGWVGR